MLQAALRMTISLSKIMYGQPAEPEENDGARPEDPLILFGSLITRSASLLLQQLSYHVYRQGLLSQPS